MVTTQNTTKGTLSPNDNKKHKESVDTPAISFEQQKPFEFAVPKPLKAKKRVFAEVSNDVVPQKTKQKITLKAVKLTQEQAQDQVLNYLKLQNRPYSAQNIFDNLHGAIPKPLLQIVLDHLSSMKPTLSSPTPSSNISEELPTNSITPPVLCKEYGKFKIYLIEQSILKSDMKEEVTEESIQKLECYLEDLTTAVSDLQKHNSTSGATDLTIDELETMKSNLALTFETKASELKRKETEILKYTKNETTIMEAPVLTNEELLLLKQQHLEYNKNWNVRKSVCIDMLSAVALSLDLTIKDVMFELGIDSDEDIKGVI